MFKSKAVSEQNPVPAEGQSESKGNYTVYILQTSSNTLYIGQTNNLEKRLKEHQSKNSKSAKYTRSFSSLQLVYSEEYPTRQDAMQREYQLKKWPRPKKDALIQGNTTLLKQL